jgi:hypothetical protein
MVLRFGFLNVNAMTMSLRKPCPFVKHERFDKKRLPFWGSPANVAVGSIAVWEGNYRSDIDIIGFKKNFFT